MREPSRGLSLFAQRPIHTRTGDVQALGDHPDAIERALAHENANAVRKAYNRTQYWDQRVRMMQWWSDKIDSLKQLNAPS